MKKIDIEQAYNLLTRSFKSKSVVFTDKGTLFPAFMSPKVVVVPKDNEDMFPICLTGGEAVDITHDYLEGVGNLYQGDCIDIIRNRGADLLRCTTAFRLWGNLRIFGNTSENERLDDYIVAGMMAYMVDSEYSSQDFKDKNKNIEIWNNFFETHMKEK